MSIACVDCGSPTRFVRCAECREEVGETRARRASCEACGAPLPPQAYPGNPRRFGCDACRIWRRRHPGESRACKRCASIPADERHPYNVQMAQRVYRANVNAARRPRAPSAPPAPAVQINACCERCAEAFTSRRPAKYCSTRCRVAASNERARLDGRYEAALAAQRAKPHVEHELTCVVCKAAFTARWRKAKYCSKTCSHAVWNPRGRVARRAALSAVWVEHVDRDVVGARDGWRCGICRGVIRRTLAYPHPRSASLDHVEPLSLGGEHSYANTRIAHLFCNLSRGNRVNNDQLALAI